MKKEIIIFGITGLLVYNTYVDNKLSKSLKSFEKYIKMITIAFIGFSLYLFLKKNPHESKNLVSHANQALKFMPVDRNTARFISPLLKMGLSGDSVKQTSNGTSIIQNLPNGSQTIQNNDRRGGSKKQLHKRSVSQVKKKFVASQQKWRCNDCQQLLEATYEVDHVIELQDGGSNDISNLVALCRNCHGKKTMMNYI
jgi:hypothetical protein